MSRRKPDLIFAKIPRGARHRVQVALRSYGGARNLELRLLRVRKDGTTAPTWTVFKIAPSSIDDLVNAVIAVRHRARRERLL